jgi:hypothetical protein
VALDVAAKARFFAPFFGGVVLFAIGNQAVGAGMIGVVLLRRLARPARVELLQNPAASLLAVSALGVILRSFLMSVAILHQSSFSWEFPSVPGASAGPFYNRGKVTPRCP